METENDFYTENEVNKIIENKWPKLDEFYKFMEEVNTKVLEPITPKKKMIPLLKDYCNLVGGYDFSVERNYGFEHNEVVIIIRFKLPFEDGNENIHLVYENKTHAIAGLTNLIKNFKP